MDPKCVLEKEDDAEAIWQGYERFKLQAHDAFAADRFATAISYSVSSCPTRHFQRVLPCVLEQQEIPGGGDLGKATVIADC